MRILLVDDDPVSGRVLEALAGAYGTSELVNSGLAAIRAVVRSMRAEEARFDLLCLDIHMPGVDGHEVLETLREVEEACGVQPGRGLKVLMVSGEQASAHVIRAFRNQCDGFLNKPVSRDEFHAALEKLQLASAS